MAIRYHFTPNHIYDSNGVCVGINYVQYTTYYDEEPKMNSPTQEELDRFASTIRNIETRIAEKEQNMKRTDKLKKVKDALSKNKAQRELTELLDAITVGEAEDWVQDKLLERSDELTDEQLERLSKILERRGML